MSKRSIGVVGGAGPMAGIALCSRIIEECQTQYKCEKDSDFPKIILISYPFSDMLSKEIDVEEIKKELKTCIHDLRKNGTNLICLSCITLYSFLDQVGDDLIYLPKLLAEARLEDPILLCTSTTRRFSSFNYPYPDEKSQKEVDLIIHSILGGTDVTKRLTQLIEAQNAKTIILGCTELSLYKDRITQTNKVIVDLMDLLVQKTCEGLKCTGSH